MEVGSGYITRAFSLQVIKTAKEKRKVKHTLMEKCGLD